MASGYQHYGAPSSYDYAAPPAQGITPQMVEHVRGAKGWMRLLSVFCFIGAGIMVLAAMSMFFFGALGAALAPRGSGVEKFTPLLGLFYLPFSALYLVPGGLLHRYANAADVFTSQASSPTLEDLLDKNRVLWKTMGISALVMIGLSILLTVGAFVLGVAAALMK